MHVLQDLGFPDMAWPTTLEIIYIYIKLYIYIYKEDHEDIYINSTFT